MRRFFLFRGSRATTIFRNATIRTALTVTIAGYTAASMLVIATSVAGLKTDNAAFEKMYIKETVALRHLAASGEAILQMRVDPGTYETLVAQGKPTDALLARIHARLADSDRELAAYLTQTPPDGRGEGYGRRTARQAPEGVFSDYRNAQFALENVQVQ